MTSDPNDDQVSPAEIPPQRWRCCDCGGTGLDSLGITCLLCDGLGFC